MLVTKVDVTVMSVTDIQCLSGQKYTAQVRVNEQQKTKTRQLRIYHEKNLKGILQPQTSYALL